jgi:fatty acid-binding protein DegV
MINAIRSDMENRFGGVDRNHIWLQIAYSYDLEAANQFKEEAAQAFPGFDIHVDPLSLSVACHIGPGALALACSVKV